MRYCVSSIQVFIAEKVIDCMSAYMKALMTSINQYCIYHYLKGILNHIDIDIILNLTVEYNNY